MPEINVVHVPPAQAGKPAVATPVAIAAVAPATDEANGGADFAAVLQKQLQQPAKDAAKTDAVADRADADAVKPDEATAAAPPPDLTTLLAGFAQMMQPLMPNAPTARGTGTTSNLTPSDSAATNLPTTTPTPLLAAVAELPVKTDTPQTSAAAPAFFAAADKLTAEPAALSAAAKATPLTEAFSDVLSNVANLHATAPPAQALAEAPATARVETPVGMHGWDNEVAQKVIWLSNRQESRAELTLTPQHLGKIEITLTTHGEQTNAMFVSASPAARDALEQALPRLRELLADAGITLGQASVNAESPRQDADQRNGNGRSERRDESTVQASASTHWIRRGDGLVDTFA